MQHRVALLATLINIAGCFVRPTRRLQPSQQRSSSAPDDESESDEIDFDFEAAYRKRVREEGGELGVRVKETRRKTSSKVAEAFGAGLRTLDIKVPKRSREAAKKGSYEDLVEQGQLLTAGGWASTVGILFLIVALATFTQLRIDPEMY